MTHRCRAGNSIVGDRRGNLSSTYRSSKGIRRGYRFEQTAERIWSGLRVNMVRMLPAFPTFLSAYPTLSSSAL
ncbi:hypothetical protein WN48_07460 [Eufriesea mexicana]|uniref:Uncharacterized protein n=1 Tax=Eufriesea mexicana TaxID=516756 RepID=A0A310SX02_9HYME|nr:hypothetical protein WN48_07460 [Eufriesea mexicana]